MSFPFTFLLGAVLFTTTVYARADVNLKNGNFTIQFTDLKMQGGIQPEISRTYNSKTEYTGMFGYGWSSKYETRILVELDGTLLVREYGGGAENRFLPVKYDPKTTQDAISKMVEIGQKNGFIASKGEIQSYRLRLETDSVFRSLQTTMMINKGYLPKKEIADGNQFVSTKFQYQYITKLKDGFIRALEDGFVEKFNLSGKLVQISDRDKNSLQLSYNSNGVLIEAVDNRMRKIKFIYDEKGNLSEVVGESGKKASFKYDKNRFLVYSKDDAGVENTFKYAEDAFRNLIEVGFPNDKDVQGNPRSMKIAYFGPEKNVSVKSVINPDGSSNDYDYKIDPKNPLTYFVSVVTKSVSGRIQKRSYDYVYDRKPNGELVTKKLIEDTNGSIKETLYDPKLSLPLKIKEGTAENTFEYDVKGRITKKITPYEVLEYAYDAASGGISKYTLKNKESPKDPPFVIVAKYDPKTKKLISAEGSNRKKIELIYDARGTVSRLKVNDKLLDFKLDEFGRLAQVALPDNKGKLNIKYNNAGDVDSTEGVGGENVRTVIQESLSHASELVDPLGISLGV